MCVQLLIFFQIQTYSFLFLTNQSDTTVKIRLPIFLHLIIRDFGYCYSKDVTVMGKEKIVFASWACYMGVSGQHVGWQGFFLFRPVHFLLLLLCKATKDVLNLINGLAFERILYMKIILYMRPIFLGVMLFPIKCRFNEMLAYEFSTCCPYHFC